MFVDETMIVQSAVSAFNNAALGAPTFFWLGVLAVPLMAMAYFCGREFMQRIGWTDTSIQNNVASFSIAIVLIWLVAFGGNYSVLRDNSSILPFCIAAVIFICAMTLGNASRGIQIPRFKNASWGHRAMVLLSIIMVLYFIAASGINTWWGPILQICAFLGGLLMGRATNISARTIPLSNIVMLAIITLMLMQPEFFRFGRLGALSVTHMGFLFITGTSLAATIALRTIKPQNRIHHSAYVKLKWMMRFVTALGIVLFILTESVPVFLGTLASLFVMFAISIWHAKSIDNCLGIKMWAITLGLFGVVTTLPVISAMGILVWIATPSIQWYKQSKFLL